MGKSCEKEALVNWVSAATKSGARSSIDLRQAEQPEASPSRESEASPSRESKASLSQESKASLSQDPKTSTSQNPNASKNMISSAKGLEPWWIWCSLAMVLLCLHREAPMNFDGFYLI